MDNRENRENLSEHEKKLLKLEEMRKHVAAVKRSQILTGVALLYIVYEIYNMIKSGQPQPPYIYPAMTLIGLALLALGLFSYRRGVRLKSEFEEYELTVEASAPEAEPAALPSEDGETPGGEGENGDDNRSGEE